MNKVYKAVEVPCFAFLMYYYLCKRSRTAKQKALISQFWKYYRLPLRGVGCLFILVGAVMIILAFPAKGSAWDGDMVALNVMAITFGILAVMFCCWNGEVK